jgi:hypothetical protein
MQQNKKIHWPNVMAPKAAVYPHIRTIHDDTVQDDYYWMIDYFKKGEKIAGGYRLSGKREYLYKVDA